MKRMAVYVFLMCCGLAFFGFFVRVVCGSVIFGIFQRSNFLVNLEIRVPVLLLTCLLLGNVKTLSCVRLEVLLGANCLGWGDDVGFNAWDLY